VRSSCPAHLIVRNLITLTTLGKWYKLQNFSLCNVPGTLREVSQMDTARDFIYVLMLFKDTSEVQNV
jgi:hypothetical protein